MCRRRSFGGLARRDKMFIGIGSLYAEAPQERNVEVTESLVFMFRTYGAGIIIC